jgi:hypothetical protein
MWGRLVLILTVPTATRLTALMFTAAATPAAVSPAGAT